MRDGKQPVGTGTDRDMRSKMTGADRDVRPRASSSTDTPPSTDTVPTVGTVAVAPRTHPSKRRRTRGGVSESGGSSSSDTSGGLGALLFGVPAEVAALMIKHCQPCDFAALCMCCRALHTLVEQALLLRSLILTPTPTPTPTSTLALIPTLIPNPSPNQGLRLRSVEQGYALPQVLPGGEARCHERVQLILSLERRRAQLGRTISAGMSHSLFISPEG
jgi:hypothetical protein